MARHDICAVGHVTNDIITDSHGKQRRAIGGAAYYAGVALSHLGLRTLVVSAAAKRDIPGIAAEFAAHSVDFQCTESAYTTTFENNYDGMAGHRSQRVTAAARPFRPSDLSGIDAASFHLGPLTAEEIPFECLETLSERKARISLDLQGFVRDASGGEVRVVDWIDKFRFLEGVNILKANRWEAAAVTNDADPISAARQLVRMGPEEVIVTLADKGAVLCIGGEVHEIPAIPVTASRDPTGCGDSFCAGYVFCRVRGRAPTASARFAAALAAIKHTQIGPFAGNAGDVDALLRR